MSEPESKSQSEPVLIRTKLHRPRPRRDAVERTRLVDQLENSLPNRLVIVSAGAGFGKTTLASQWMERATVRAAWLSLDPLDNDLERFTRYLVAALEEVLPGRLPRSSELLLAAEAPAWSYFIDVLLSELEPTRERLVVVLEDYHAITSEEIHELVARLLVGLPDSMQLLVLTRVDPPFPLGRWRGKGWLGELRSRDLRFSLEEASQFLGSLPHLHLDDEIVATLHRRTEGWIAGLQMAGLSLSGLSRPDARVRALSGVNRNIADFMIEEVLAVQPPEVREFLTIAAPFERFCAELCDHILGDTRPHVNSRAIIERLESQNLFIVTLDEQRGWYRFHHLFRDSLLERLGDSVTSEMRERVYRRAAEWLARHATVGEALRCWVAVGDLDHAAELIGEHVDSVMMDPSRRLMAQWLGHLPARAEVGRAPILIAQAWQHVLRWDHAGLAQVLDAVDRLPPLPPSSLRANVDALKAYLSYWSGDGEAALRHAHLTLAGPAMVGGGAWSFANIYGAGALAMSGRLDEAIGMLDHAIEQGFSHGFFASGPTVIQGIVYLNANRLDQARERARHVTESHKRTPVPPFWLGYAEYLLGREAYERNRLDEAEDCFGRVEQLRYLVTTRLYQDTLVGLALVARARGDTVGMAEHAASARAWAVEAKDPISHRIADSLDSRLGLSAGPEPPVTDAPPPIDDYQSFWLETPSVTRAELLIAHPSPDVRARALPYIEAALERMRQNHNARLGIVFSLLLASALETDGRRADALAILASTLRDAAPLDLLRTFLDRGPMIRKLLDELAAREGRDDYRDRIRGAFSELDSKVQWRGRHSGDPLRLLSYREIEVLELFADRLTDKEISARLGVTPEAVKKRARNIFRKLGAEDRRHAVALALSKGILRQHP